MKHLSIHTATADYEISIASDLKAEILKYLTNNAKHRQIIVISNPTILSYHRNWLDDLLKDFNATVIEVVDSEDAKSLTVANSIYSQLLDLKADRKSLLIAFGGGVVGDLCGFIAASYMRGIDFIQIPTSLLAQVDSSVGGKVAVNHKKAKNVIGHFYQPIAVFIDLLFLKTLEKREIICGFAEMLKMAFILDQRYLDDLIDTYNEEQLIPGERLERLIYRSIELKAQIVEEDEKEHGIRAILNFGHTVAHAIETLDNYKTIKHGEAVLLGLKPALLLSGIAVDNKYLKFIIALIADAKLTYQFDSNDMLDVMLRDKKNEMGEIHFILLKEIGKAYKKALPKDLIISNLGNV